MNLAVTECVHWKEFQSCGGAVVFWFFFGWKLTMRWLVIFLTLCAGCSRQPATPVTDAQKQSSDSTASIEDLRRLAEEGKAALNGDETASLWTGRAALHEPAGRIEAAAWFLIGKTGGNAAMRQDAENEIEAKHHVVPRASEHPVTVVRHQKTGVLRVDLVCRKAKP